MCKLLSLMAAALLFTVAALAGGQEPAKQPLQDKQDKKDPQEKPKSSNLGKDKDGNPLRLAFKTNHISNYDEAKVKPYTLPDPLVLSSGEPVRDAETWYKKRRPEILKLFQTEIFGRIPAGTPKVKWEVATTEEGALDGKATMKKVVGHMTDRADGPRMNVT